ncbi:hypothetical protein DFH09DRAFT_379720 [Mycena vulgaris]|nr:hypothetical protein DFH09DRAFT_379720 [Mycena vulgaris]
MVELDKAVAFRIVSFSLAAGDVIQTIPGTVAMYKKQWVRGRLSAACLFYIIARYMSIISLVLNVFGGIGVITYTLESCKRFYMFPNITALLAGMAVQVVVYIRTYAISGRSKYVRFGLGSVLLLGFPVQIFGIVYHRDPSFKPVNGSCKGMVLHTGEPDWNIVYYSAHMTFDLIACATATYYLVASSRALGVLHFSKLLRRILRDGLCYFLVVFLVNLWVVLEFAKVFSSGAASSVPIAVVLIAVQHLTLSTQTLSSRDRLFTEDYSGSISQGPPRFHPMDRPRQLDVELQSVAFVTDTFGEPRDQKALFNSGQVTSQSSATLAPMPTHGSKGDIP